MSFWLCLYYDVAFEFLCDRDWSCQSYTQSNLTISVVAGTASRTTWTSTVAPTSAVRTTSHASTSRRASRPFAPTTGYRSGMIRGKQVRSPLTSPSEWMMYPCSSRTRSCSYKGFSGGRSDSMSGSVWQTRSQINKMVWLSFSSMSFLFTCTT